MRCGRLGVLSVVLAAVTICFLVAPAGAAPAVGKITVSNSAPEQASAIDIASTGWRPGSAVSVTLSDDVIGRATAGATGAVHVRVSIPSNAAPGFDVLSVNGATPGGIPQQIVTGLSVPAPARAPAPKPPWTIVCVLAALAAVLLLASERVGREPAARLSPVRAS